MGLAGAGSLEGRKEAATSLDAASLEHARFGFHLKHRQRSARRVFFFTQVITFALIIAGFVWAVRNAPNLTFFALHVAALMLFTTAIDLSSYE